MASKNDDEEIKTLYEDNLMLKYVKRIEKKN